MSTLKSSAEDLTLNADGSGNDIKFQSNGVEKASIDQNGSLVLNSRMTSATGTISTAGDGDNPVFQVIDTADTFVAQFEGRRDNVYPSIKFYHNDATAHASNNGFGLGYFTNNDAAEKVGAANIIFQNVSVTDGAEEAKIRFLTMSSGTNTDRVVIHPSGVMSASAGIELGSGVDATAANTLDDYEEGTWTISVSEGTVGAGDGIYIKIGNKVTAWFQANTFSDRTTAGDIELRGLPFASSSSAGNSCCGSIMYRYSDNTAASESYIGNSSTNINFYGLHSGTWDTLKYNDWNNSQASMYGSITYYVD